MTPAEANGQVLKSNPQQVWLVLIRQALQQMLDVDGLGKVLEELTIPFKDGRVELPHMLAEIVAGHIVVVSGQTAAHHIEQDVGLVSVDSQPVRAELSAIDTRYDPQQPLFTGPHVVFDHLQRIDITGQHLLQIDQIRLVDIERCDRSPRG